MGCICPKKKKGLHDVFDEDDVQNEQNQELLRDTVSSSYSNIQKNSKITKNPYSSRQQKSRIQNLQNVGEQDIQDQLYRESQHAHQFQVQGIDSATIAHFPKEVSLADFIYKKVIGRGAFGKVLLVTKKESRIILTTLPLIPPTFPILNNLETFYAMKIMKKDEIEMNNIRFYMEQEKTIMQSLDSPFVVRLHYAFQTPQKLYMIQDFMIGGELFFHLRRQFKFSENTTKFYTAQIILALEYLHSKNIIYRDLKPENILLDNEGNLKLTDFGLSKRGNKTTYTIVGTPEYQAPEILIGDGHYKEVDWYSLGCLVFEMLSGAVPFQPQNEDNIEELKQLKLDGTVIYPSYFTPQAVSLISGLIRVDPTERLGNNGSKEIKQHPFFQAINFDLVKNKEYPTPFKPKLTEQNDLRYFDPMFLDQKLADSPSNSVIKEYIGFSYASSNHISVATSNIRLKSGFYQ